MNRDNSVASIKRVKYKFYKLPGGRLVPLKKNEMKKVTKMMNQLELWEEAGLDKTKKFRDLLVKASMLFRKGIKRVKSTIPSDRSVNVNPQLKFASS